MITQPHPPKPDALAVHPETIPDELKRLDRWVVWRHDRNADRWAKVLYQPNHPTSKAKSNDASTWSTFDEALACYTEHRFDGIGIALGELDDGRTLAGVDLDDCLAGGDAVGSAQRVVDDLATYTEISPSGTGVKSFLFGRKPAGSKCKAEGDGFKQIEVYDSVRWFAVTGARYGDIINVAACNGRFQTLCNEHLAPSKTPRKQSSPTTTPNNAETRCMAYLAKTPDSVAGQDGHGRLLRAACECFRFGLDRTTARRVLDWFNTTKCDPPWSDCELEHKLGDALAKVTADGEIGNRNTPLAASSKADPILSTPEPRAAREVKPGKCVPLGTRDPKSGRLVLSPRRTLPTAGAYIREFHTTPDGQTILCVADDLLVWAGNRYQPVEDGEVRGRLSSWLHSALRHIKGANGDPELVDFESNPMTVRGALDTIKAHAHLSADTPSPSWLVKPDKAPPIRELLPCRTMNLHIPSGKTLPATPAMFTTCALEFDPQPHTPEPNAWLAFLAQLWPDDPESIELLQDWFGYCLTPDTSQQKALLMVGPKRSGKGTLGRVLAQLVGRGNTCGPTTSSLAGNFGLQPLVGKSLAIVSDAGSQVRVSRPSSSGCCASPARTRCRSIASTKPQ